MYSIVDNPQISTLLDQFIDLNQCGPKKETHTDSSIREIQEAVQKLQTCSQRLEIGGVHSQNALQESINQLEEVVQRLKNINCNNVQSNSPISKHAIMLQLQNDKIKLIEYMEKLKIYIERLIGCTNAEINNPYKIQPGLLPLKEDIEQLKKGIQQLKEISITAQQQNVHSNMPQLINGRDEIIAYTIDFEKYTQDLICYIENKHLFNNTGNFQLQTYIDQLTSDGDKLQNNINRLVTNKLMLDIENYKKENDKLKKENIKMLASINRWTKHKYSVRTLSGQKNSYIIPSHNIETLIDNIKCISKNHKTDLKKLLEKDFEFMKFYDCKSLENTPDQVVENIKLKEMYENAQIYSEAKQENINCFNYENLINEIKSEDITSWIKEDSIWVLRVFNLLLDNLIQISPNATESTLELSGKGYAKYCCLAWCLSDIRNLEEKDLNKEVAEFCDTSYPKDPQGNSLSELEIRSLVYKTQKRNFRKINRIENISSLRKEIDINLIKFKDFLIYKADQYRVKLFTYINLSTHPSNLGNMTFNNCTITNKGLRKLLNNSIEGKITVLSGANGFKSPRPIKRIKYDSELNQTSINKIA